MVHSSQPGLSSSSSASPFLEKAGETTFSDSLRANDPGLWTRLHGLCREVVGDGSYGFAWVGRLDAESGALIPVAQAGWGDGEILLPILHREAAEPASPAAFRALEEDSIRLVADLWSAAGDGAWAGVGLALGCRAAAAFPLRWNADQRGVLSVYALSEEHFASMRLQRIETAALGFLPASGSAHPDREDALRVAELESLRLLMGSLVSTIDLDSLLTAVVVRATDLLRGSAGSLYLSTEDHAAVRCVVSHPTPPDYTGTVLRYGEGAAGMVAQTGELLCINDYAGWPGRASFFEGLPADRYHKLLSVPLLIRGRTIGVLHVWRGIEAPAFVDEEIRLLSLFAGHAAVAVENARLLDDSRRRLNQRTQLNEITHTALQSLDAAWLLEELARRLAVLSEASFCWVRVEAVAPPGEGDPARPDSPRWHAFHGPEVDEDIAAVLEQWFAGVEMRVIGPGGLPAGPPWPGHAPAWHALLGLPLRGRTGLMGYVVLGFASTAQVSQEQIALCEQACGLMALALERAQAFAAERQHAAELEALRLANLRLTSRLEVGPVLEAVLEHAIKWIEADDAHVFIYDGERLTFGAAMWASGAKKTPFSEPRPDGLTYPVARSGNRIVVADAMTHRLYRGQPWEGAIIGLPLRLADQVVGVMNVAYLRPHAFAEAEIRLLELLADQAAIAIQNARLFEESTEERRRLHLLYTVTQALASSQDPDEIVQRATELTVGNFGALFGEAFLLERGTDRLRLRGLAGKDPGLIPQLDDLFQAKLGWGLVGWIAEQRAPANVADVTTDPRWAHVYGVDEDVRSALGVPLLAGNDLLGALMIFHREPAAFSRDQQDVLVAIGQQIGLALSNAEAFQQVERRLAEMSVLRQVAQVINRRLEMQKLLEEVVHQVGGVLGYPVVEILLVEGEDLVRRAWIGTDQDVPMRMPLEAGVVGKAARSNRPTLVTDVGQDSDYIEVLPATSTEIAVPLRKGGVVFGVLNVESPTPGGLTGDDLRLLSLLGDQISVAIENAALYDHLRQHADDLEKTVAERTGELAEALRLAQEADSLKSRFVSDVSHELRTPLSNMSLYLDLMRAGKPERFEEYMETLERETGRLIALIEDLLAISRLEAGTARLQLAPLDLNALAGGLVDDRRRLFAEKGLALTFRPESGLPTVHADERALARVVGNLMTNALQYTPSGSVTVSTEVQHKDGHRWATLTVTDTGRGIPEEEKSRLFTRFFRGSAGRLSRTPGTGLGLAICKETLQQHSGRITVDSEEGKGTAFAIWLPLDGDAVAASTV